MRRKSRCFPGSRATSRDRRYRSSRSLRETPKDTGDGVKGTDGGAGGDNHDPFVFKSLHFRLDPALLTGSSLTLTTRRHANGLHGRLTPLGCPPGTPVIPLETGNEYGRHAG